MDEPPEEILPFDVGHTVGLFDGRETLGYPKLQASMRTSPVVVLDIDPKDAIEMPGAEDQQPVQALRAKRLYPALGEGVVCIAFPIFLGPPSRPTGAISIAAIEMRTPLEKLLERAEEIRDVIERHLGYDVVPLLVREKVGKSDLSNGEDPNRLRARMPSLADPAG